ncbi:hypothetical protein BBJ28_00022384 [Nothophytophthora sp. Chile5]|nr:hypothetical protein BBJ28_00022384 [Nothophytophthora sp. Chile5]
MANGERSLKACADSDASRNFKERAIQRRAAKVEQLQHQRRLDVDTVLVTSHKSNLTGITAATDSAELFGDDLICILDPEVTQGPYYVIGEIIIDVNSCEPASGQYVDFWDCNATGVYSGIVALGNGDSSDTANVKNTFLLSLSPTNEDGLASFTTIFPGHYSSHATHIRVLGTYSGTLLENNTYSGGYASHVGPIVYDQDLISEVEATSAYSVNTQELTDNADDSFLSEEAAETFDPVVEYALLS